MHGAAASSPEFKDGERMTPLSEDKAQNAIAGVLRYGSLISSLVMAAAVVLFLLRGAPSLTPASRPDSPLVLLRRALTPEAAAMAELGILLMLLTPILRILTAATSFALQREYRYVAISLGVLVILVLSIAFALR